MTAEVIVSFQILLIIKVLENCCILVKSQKKYGMSNFTFTQVMAAHNFQSILIVVSIKPNNDKLCFEKLIYCLAIWMYILFASLFSFVII